MYSFSDIAYSPIDHPINITPSIRMRITAFFEQRKIRLSAGWDVVYLTKSYHLENLGLHHNLHVIHKLERNLNWDWTDEVKNEIPELATYVNILPLQEFTSIFLVSNYKDINPHNDICVSSKNSNIKTVVSKESIEHLSVNDPSFSYRVVMYGDPSEQFYMCEPINWEVNGPFEEVHVKNKTFVKLPKDTNCFVFSTTNCSHGAIFKYPKLLLGIKGFPDEEKHVNLVEKVYKNTEII